MSLTVSPDARVSEAGCVIGDCCTTVLVSCVSIAPVAIRIAPMTTATPPPTRPDMTFAFLTGTQLRRATLTSCKTWSVARTNARRQRDVPANAPQRTPSGGERGAQRAPVGRRRSGRRARREAAVAQRAHVEHGAIVGQHAQSPFELSEGGAGRDRISEQLERGGQLGDRRLVVAAAKPACPDRDDRPEGQQREREQRGDCAEREPEPAEGPLAASARGRRD